MLENTIDQNSTLILNESLTLSVLEEAVKCGVQDFCICPGNRNAPFISALKQQPQFKKYYWFEERSAAFFALGLSRRTNRPVAVIVTSGTAAGELLPAIMEAYYSGIPLLMITADRPSSYRNTGAPQTAEQVGLYGIYTKYCQDLEGESLCDLSGWDKRGPAHINVCLEEPLDLDFKSLPKNFTNYYPTKINIPAVYDRLNTLLHNSRYPFIIVSALHPNSKESVVDFLCRLGAPVYLEGISNLREETRLKHLQIIRSERLWEASSKVGYEIDAVIRIGGVPTIRFWRDLETKNNVVDVYSINEVPFSGLSWADNYSGSIQNFFKNYKQPDFEFCSPDSWINNDRIFYQKLNKLILEEPQAESSMISALSKLMPHQSQIFLGTSLPIREWDMAASLTDRDLTLTANRGLNGIDGEISTFLGWAHPQHFNCAILGDLTTLYDLAGPWIISQLPDIALKIFIINNGGGKIFKKLFPGHDEMLNQHDIDFAPFAALWRLSYKLWETIPDVMDDAQLIEIVPDENATERFWKKLETIYQEC